MTDRAQTTLDFAIGMSVFLITTAFVFTFAPGLVAPFTGGQEAAPVVANRLADDLVQDELAVEGDPYVLNETAVQALPSDENALRDDLHLPATTFVNVTVEGANGTVRVARGAAPPPSEETAVAWRVVTYDGERGELRVSVW